MQWIRRSVGILVIVGAVAIVEPILSDGNSAAAGAAPAAVSAAAGGGQMCWWCFKFEEPMVNPVTQQWEWVYLGECVERANLQGAEGCINPFWLYDGEGNWMGANCIMWGGDDPCECDGENEDPYYLFPDCYASAPVSELSFDGYVAAAERVSSWGSEGTDPERLCTGVLLEQSVTSGAALSNSATLKRLLI